MPKVYKQSRDDTKVKVVYKASSIPTPACSVEQKDVGMVLCILPSLLRHLYLVCVPFGMLSQLLYAFVFLFAYFFGLQLLSVYYHTPEKFS